MRTQCLELRRRELSLSLSLSPFYSRFFPFSSFSLSCFTTDSLSQLPNVSLTQKDYSHWTVFASFQFLSQRLYSSCRPSSTNAKILTSTLLLNSLNELNESRMIRQRGTGYWMKQRWNWINLKRSSENKWATLSLCCLTRLDDNWQSGLCRLRFGDSITKEFQNWVRLEEDLSLQSFTPRLLLMKILSSFSSSKVRSSLLLERSESLRADKGVESELN